MKKIDNFDVLSKMCDKDLNIKLFSLDDNLVSSSTGKNGWGKITIAVDNVTIEELNRDMTIGKNTIAGKLLIFSIEDFEKTKKEMEAEQ